MWLEQPQENAMSGPWKERQITNTSGPGVSFCITQLDNTDESQIVAAQFFAAQQLSVWWCDAHGNTSNSTWSGCENGIGVQSAIIDDTEHAPYFNVQWVDLNSDGRKEILATTNEANGKGSVLAYEAPADYRTGAWIKHRLADGYKPKQAYLPGRGSPGTARAFFAHKSDDRPSILVSADDGGWFDLLSPTSEDFVYKKTRIINSTNTVGTPAIADLNGDGYAEFAVPLFAENKVEMYTFAP